MYVTLRSSTLEKVYTMMHGQKNIKTVKVTHVN